MRLKSGFTIVALFVSTLGLGSHPVHVLFLEAGGAGGLASVNYDWRFWQHAPISFTLRTGVGGFRLRDYSRNFSPDLAFPFHLNFLYGRVEHYLEVGAGPVLSSLVYANPADNGPVRKSEWHTGFSLGYRFQQSGRGLFFRMAYTPVLKRNEYLMHWGGMGVGYTF